MFLSARLIASNSSAKTAMGGEFVLDASVAAKLFFIEEHSDLAAAALRVAERLIAPELLFLEIASIAAKHSRRGFASSAQGMQAVRSIVNLLDETVPLLGLAPRAFALAETHGCSVYDGAYLALAEERNVRLLTADMKLVRLARQSGLGDFMCPLAESS